MNRRVSFSSVLESNIFFYSGYLWCGLVVDDEFCNNFCIKKDRSEIIKKYNNDFFK